MKTLDEVMNALKNCGRHPKSCVGCPYESVSYVTKIGNTCKDVMHYDAFNYLKEYRDKMANDEEAYKRGYSCGYAKAKEDEAVSRSWDESYRASQMPWNHGCEMGG